MGISVISAGTQVATWGTIVLSNSGGISFGMSNSSVITASANNSITASYVNAMLGAAVNGPLVAGAGAGGTNTVSLWPVFGAGMENTIQSMVVSTFMLGISGGTSQSTASGSMLFSLGVYTLNASTLSLLNSVATSITWAAVSNNSTAFSGLRWLTIHSSQWSSQPVFTQTNYWMGVLAASSNATQGFRLAAYNILDSASRQGTIGVSSSASTYLIYPFLGQMQSASLPSSIQTSQMVSLAGGSQQPVVVFNNVMASF